MHSLHRLSAAPLRRCALDICSGWFSGPHFEHTSPFIGTSYTRKILLSEVTVTVVTFSGPLFQVHTAVHLTSSPSRVQVLLMTRALGGTCSGRSGISVPSPMKVFSFLPISCFSQLSSAFCTISVNDSI